MSLAHRVCIVTGGSSLVGRAVCRRLARLGAHVVVTDVDGGGAEALAAEIGGVAFRTDLSDPVETTALVAHVEQRVGPIDLVCWNVPSATPGGLELPDSVWRQEWPGSVTSYLGLARLVVPDMARRGQGWLASIAPWEAWRPSAAVSATVAVSNAATAALTRWLGQQYQTRGVRAVALVPPLLSEAGTVFPEARPVDPDGVASLLVMALPAEGHHCIEEKGRNS